MNQELSWGFTEFVSEDNVLERIQTFHTAITKKDAEASQSADVMVVPPFSDSAAASAPVYRLRGTLVVRFVSATAWAKSSSDMAKNPSKYLFLDTVSTKPVSVQVEPSYQTRSLEESMLDMLKDAETDGDVTFMVGGGAGKPFRAHSNIIRMATLVKLFQLDRGR